MDFRSVSEPLRSRAGRRIEISDASQITYMPIAIDSIFKRSPMAPNA